MHSIENLGHKYNLFQTQVGQSLSEDWAQEINSLFSQTFTKRINGQIAVSKSVDLQPQLLECLKGSGPWQIKVAHVIPSYDNKMCTIRYIIATEKAGTFDIIALIKSENGQTIDAIDEIYYQVAPH